MVLSANDSSASVTRLCCSASAAASSSASSARPAPCARRTFEAWASHRLQELLATEHTADLLLPAVLVQLLDPRVRRIAGDLLDAEVAFRDGRDLRQVRDRDHLRPLREPAQRLAHCVRRLAADAR